MKEQQIAEIVEKSEVKNFEHADKVQEFPNARIELVKAGGVLIGRITLQPGWRWSESMGPVFKTDSCEAGHLMYQLSGTVRIRMDDGKEFECHAGDVCVIPSGHDAWVVGNEPVVTVDFQGMSTYYGESE